MKSMMRSLGILVLSSTNLLFVALALRIFRPFLPWTASDPLRLSVEICRDYGWSGQKYLQPQNRLTESQAKSPKKSPKKLDQNSPEIHPILDLSKCSTKSNVTHTISRASLQCPTRPWWSREGVCSIANPQDLNRMPWTMAFPQYYISNHVTSYDIVSHHTTYRISHHITYQYHVIRLCCNQTHYQSLPSTFPPNHSRRLLPTCPN